VNFLVVYYSSVATL